MKRYVITNFPIKPEPLLLFDKMLGDIDIIIEIPTAEKPIEMPPEELGERKSILEMKKLFGGFDKIEGVAIPEEIYAKICEIIRPRLIFIYGPPKSGKTSLAKKIAKKIHYKYNYNFS